MTPTKAVRDIETRTIWKIKARILPLVFLLYIIAFLDRANVAYAKLTMSTNLGFSEAVYGLGAGLFFAGYVLLEVPGALIVQRWGARLWMTRIMITWGLCTALVGMSRTAHQFYATRFLLGAAEGGFFPGIVVYLNEWFPSKYRASALGPLYYGKPNCLGFGRSACGADSQGTLARLSWLAMGFRTGRDPRDHDRSRTAFHHDRPPGASFLVGAERKAMVVKGAY